MCNVGIVHWIVSVTCKQRVSNFNPVGATWGVRKDIKP